MTLKQSPNIKTMTSVLCHNRFEKVKYKGENFLHLAVRYGNLEMVKLLCSS